MLDTLADRLLHLQPLRRAVDRGSDQGARSSSRSSGFNRIGYKLDAVISGFAIGAGFSVVENIFYLMRFPDYGAGTWLVRGLGTAVMHGTTLAILAAIAHEFAERETREAAGEFDFRLWWFVPGYLVAVALHTAFNQFPDRPMLAMLGAAIVRAAGADRDLQLRHRRGAAWLVAECAEHRAQLERSARGSWPDSPAGQQDRARLPIALGPEAAKRIRRYWELQAWLVAEAEETMMEEAAGDAEFDTEQVARRLCRARRTEARARPQHLRRAAGAPSVQPQRSLGSRRA